MVLEHSKDPVSARWNPAQGSWDIGERIKYRWTDTKGNPTSDWYHELNDALGWIKAYDEARA
jgi:hypothetical protein